MSPAVRRIITVIIALAVVALVIYAFVPEPVPIDVARVTQGHMRVTVDEEGKTRIRERYVISAPLTGKLRRIDLDAGDRVEANTTIAATIEPTDPTLLDARARAEAEARVSAAESAVQRAGANHERARALLDFAENELTRVREARAKGAASPQEIQTKEHANESAMKAYRASKFAGDIARYELDLARSALLHTQPEGVAPDQSAQFHIRAPITGCVLRIFQESVAVVGPGTPLLEVGDPSDLEVVIDVLSTDAVRIRPGQTIVIEHWGGDQPLRATVRLVEPSAFTKVSALGVEEQRVNVVADFTSPVSDRRTLGDGYRVEAAVVLWEGDDVVQVPSSCLFRRGESWAVFVDDDDRARHRDVEIGLRNGMTAQVLAGLEPGERVILHPSDRVDEGTRVAERGAP